jgi:hypothetical protein
MICDKFVRYGGAGAEELRGVGTQGRRSSGARQRAMLISHSPGHFAARIVEFEHYHLRLVIIM